MDIKVILDECRALVRKNSLSLSLSLRCFRVTPTFIEKLYNIHTNL